MQAHCVAALMSLFGVKWSGTRAIFPRSNTVSRPNFGNSPMATGAVMSLPSTRSSRAITSSPAWTSLRPACAAIIFWLIVIPAIFHIPSVSCFRHLSPFTFHPSPFTLHLSPFTFHPSPFIFHPSPFPLHLSPASIILFTAFSSARMLPLMMSVETPRPRYVPRLSAILTNTSPSASRRSVTASMR